GDETHRKETLHSTLILAHSLLLIPGCAAREVNLLGITKKTTPKLVQVNRVQTPELLRELRVRLGIRVVVLCIDAVRRIQARPEVEATGDQIYHAVDRTVPARIGIVIRCMRQVVPGIVWTSCYVRSIAGLLAGQRDDEPIINASQIAVVDNSLSIRDQRRSRGVLLQIRDYIGRLLVLATRRRRWRRPRIGWRFWCWKPAGAGIADRADWIKRVHKATTAPAAAPVRPIIRGL